MKISDQLGDTVDLVWNEKAQDWPGIWKLAYWIFCVSGQAEHLQGHDTYLNFILLTWHHGQEQLHLGPRKLFPKPLTN